MNDHYVLRPVSLGACELASIDCSFFPALLFMSLISLVAARRYSRHTSHTTACQAD